MINHQYTQLFYAPYLKTLLQQLGADVIGCHTVPDCPPSDCQNTFVELVNGAVQSGVNMIVSCGAVSAGASDFVKGGLEHMGAEILDAVKNDPFDPNDKKHTLQGGGFVVAGHFEAPD